MSIRELIRLSRARWWLVLICVVAGGVLAAAAALVTPAKFVSTTRLLVATPNIAAQEFLPPGNLTPQQQAANVANLVTGSNIAQQVIDELHLDLPIKKLLDATAADVLPGTSIVAIKVTDAKPVQAQRIATAFAENLTAAMPKLQQASGAPADQVTVTITDPATLPRTATGTGMLSFIGLGVIAGLVIGVVLVRFLAFLDNSVRRERELAELTGRPVLATVDAAASAESSSGAVTVGSHSAGSRPAGSVGAGSVGAGSAGSVTSPADAYRRLRAALTFSADAEQVRTIAIAGVDKSAGATTTAANLAVSMARGGRRVLLIDADLHHPRVAELAALPSEHAGLAEVLAGATLAETVQSGPVQRLDVLTAGARVDDPGEHVQSATMTSVLAGARAEYDVVIVDLPPLRSCTDAFYVAASSDGALLVVRSGHSDKDQVTAAVEQLGRVRANLIGCVLTTG